MLRIASLLTVSLAVALLTGCGGQPAATASGSVKYGGEPVANGSIIFQANDKTGGAAKAQIVDGKYQMGPDSGLTAGSYRVQIHGYKKSAAASAGPNLGSEAIDDPEMAVTESAGPPTGTDPNMAPYIPSIYNATTTLTVEIAAGENAGKDFDLKAVTETFGPE